MFNPLKIKKMEKTYLELAEEFEEKFQNCTLETEFKAIPDANGIEVISKFRYNLYCVENAALFCQYNNLKLYISRKEKQDGTGEMIPVLRMF